MSSRFLEKPEIVTLTKSSRRLKTCLDSRRLGDQQMFAVKHLTFSKLVYRLKSCNFVSKEIAKTSHIKLSEILERAIL